MDLCKGDLGTLDSDMFSCILSRAREMVQQIVATQLIKPALARQEDPNGEIRKHVKPAFPKAESFSRRSWPCLWEEREFPRLQKGVF